MIYLKFFGAVLVAACGALLGRARSVQEQERATLLADLCAALSEMADEISALQTPIPQLLSRISSSERPGALFFNSVLNNLQKMSLSEAWQCACPLPELSDTERELLRAVSSGLGRFDAEAQSAELRLAASRLEKCLNLRREKIQREGRMSTALGASLGAMCAVVLF